MATGPDVPVSVPDVKKAKSALSVVYVIDYSIPRVPIKYNTCCATTVGAKYDAAEDSVTALSS